MTMKTYRYSLESTEPIKLSESKDLKTRSEPKDSIKLSEPKD